jgi:hypothetical protein
VRLENDSKKNIMENSRMTREELGSGLIKKMDVADTVLIVKKK